MKLFSTLRLWKNTLLYTTGLSFYTKKQTYDVDYRITLTNKSPRVLTTELVIPVPQEIGGQKLVSEFKTSQEGVVLQKEPKYQNTYLVTKLELKPKQEFEIELIFQISAQPTQVSISDDLDLSDYSSKTLEKYANYLKPNKFLDNTNKEVISLGQGLLNNETKIARIIGIFNNYVQSRLTYGNQIPGLYTVKDSLTNSKVDCGGFDALLGSLCKASGIPSRVVSGFWVGYTSNKMHAWLQILTPSEIWIPLDPSVEQLFKQGRTQRFASLGHVGSDRIITGLGEDFEIKGVKTDILQNSFVTKHAQDISISVELLSTSV